MQPIVKCLILMVREQLFIVIYLIAVFLIPARGLQTDEHVACQDAGNPKLFLISHHDLSRRFAPLGD